MPKSCFCYWGQLLYSACVSRGISAFRCINVVGIAMGYLPAFMLFSESIVLNNGVINA